MKKSSSVNKKSVKPSVEMAPQSWWKVSIHFKNRSECKHMSLPLAIKVKQAVSGIMLYFARYMNVTENRTDLYFCLPPDRIGSEDHVRILLRSINERTFNVDLPAKCGPGSMAHAYGFEAVMALYMRFLYCEPDSEPYELDGMNMAVRELADVHHWMCNMLGLDYCDEAKLNLYGLDRIVNIFHQSITMGNKLSDATTRLEKKKAKASRN